MKASTFGDLLQRHRRLLQDRGIDIRPFTASRELEEFKALREERCQAMARQGLIAFTDPTFSH